MKTPASALLLLVCSSLASAQVLLDFDTSGLTGTTEELWPSNVAEGVTSSSLNRSGLTPQSGAGVFVSSQWNVGSLDLSTDYVSFVLQADAGFSASLEQLSFGVSGTNTAPSTLAVAYSTDGFTSSTISSTYGITSLTQNAEWDFQDFSLLSGETVEFRIYAYGPVSVNGGSSGLGGTVRLSDISLGGTVSAVPEPATYAVLAGGMTLLTAAIVRRSSGPRPRART